jgi:hypothetical protein
VWRRRGSEEGEAGRRVQEVQTQSQGADLRIPDGRFAENQTPECGVKFHARISSSTVGPRKSRRNVQICRDVDRPVTIKARVIEWIFSFREASTSFQNVFFVRVWVGDLACKRPVRPTTDFFNRSFSIYILGPRPLRDFFYLNFSFLLGKRSGARGDGPADRGRRKRLASWTISDFTFGSTLFLSVFEFNLLSRVFLFLWR